MEKVFVNPLHLPVEEVGLSEMKFRFQKKARYDIPHCG